MEDPIVTRFREYIQIQTVEPNIDYDAALKFLKNYLDEIGLQHRILEVVAGRPMLIATWQGTDPTLPSLLLNSHIDVVPVFREQWKYDPFIAFKDSAGKIYGRGTQDMKSVTIQYLEAIRRLRNSGKTMKRTIHMSFVADEEIGGHSMQALLESKEWEQLNVGFALDEGLANPTEEFTVFYGEKMPWWIKITCTGNPGHGSRFIENTAAEKLKNIINKLLDFREKEKTRMESNPQFTLGDVTSVNLTRLEGGIATNVVPAEVAAVFDIRVTPNANLCEFEQMLYQWCREAGEGVHLTFLQKYVQQVLTPISKGNIWWDAFSSACDSMNIRVKCEIFPANTDSRFLRRIGVPALGFSPMNNTPILLHDHNEFIDENIFLRGIDIYENIILALANA